MYDMRDIRFQAKLETIGTHTVLRLPAEASLQLPSRGLVMIEGTINGHEFQAPLEPDGQKGHWLMYDDELRQATGAAAGDTLSLEIQPSTNWPEPEVPSDLQAALDNDPEAKAMWDSTTPLARWDWIRSVRSTPNPETRKRRIETACSKLRGGKPRQCCFNRSECTVPDVSKGGRLLTSQ